MLVRATFEASQFDTGNDSLTVSSGETHTVRATETTQIDSGTSEVVASGETLSTEGQIDVAGQLDVAGTVEASNGYKETYSSIEVAGELEVAGTLESTGADGGSTITIAVLNNPENDLGVLTDIGQESIRDIIADNAPILPQFYAYGSDDTSPTEADTGLGLELAKQDLDKIVVQTASTTVDWEGLI